MHNHPRIKQRIVTLAFVLASLFTAHESFAKDSDVKEVYYGYMEFAPPISFSSIYGKGNSEISGYCGDLSNYLQGRGYKLLIRKQSRDDRFRGFKSNDQMAPALKHNQGGIECGPHSITFNRRKLLENLTKSGGYKSADFSKPFYTSSMKFIVNNDYLSSFYGNSRGLKMAVQMSTTNRNVIGSIFQDQELTNTDMNTPNPTFEVVETRLNAIDKLISKDIDAYAGDEVILTEMLKDLRQKVAEKNLQLQFSIEPKLYGFTREDYGIVVYNSKKLLDQVNEWIDKDDGGQAARKKWLEHRRGILALIEFFLRQNYGHLFFYLFVAVAFLLILSHQLFILVLLRILPRKITDKLYVLLKAVSFRNKHSNPNLFSLLSDVILNNYLVVFQAHCARGKMNKGHLRKKETIILIQAIGIQPLSEEYHKEGLDENQATRKAIERIKGIESNDPGFSDFLKRYCGATLDQIIEEVNKSAISNLIK